MNANRKIYWGLAIIITTLLAVWFFTKSNPDETILLETPVKQGLFVINVTTTGELEAKSSEKIYGPSSAGLREARIWELKIDDIIPDGTIVDSGDFVANLDRTELTNKLKDKEIEIEQFQNNFTKTQLDTTMELRSARNDLVNLKYAMEEAQIAVDQSIYEPPASQRQVQIELDKSKRSYDQADMNYSLRTEKAVANMSEVSTALKKKQGEYQKLMDLIGEFTVNAPKSGMVIYQRDWEGKKRGIGSTVSAWENVVATLPNLREMITKTYVNEIDISKVKVGQKVNIGIDAFPDKKFTGQVLEVANIGEQIRNSNAKVFEVKIGVNEYDSIIRPAMTTKNTIITDEIDSMLYIPLEAMLSNDSIQYVIVGKHKQQVITGKSNENEIIILAGLTEKQNVLLSLPPNIDDYDMKLLSNEVIQSAKARKELLEKAEMNSKPGLPGKDSMPPNGSFQQRGNTQRPNRPSKR
ncbi:MAG: HlyD family efflux transporter periplasmic adaptor subunit [Bacteroidales bacterium]|nr:HlyD family efflux transporter periplasmic adaptor subunit [Bacteroidales bacterium]